jgi:prophage regulatory protein
MNSCSSYLVSSLLANFHRGRREEAAPAEAPQSERQSCVSGSARSTASGTTRHGHIAPDSNQPRSLINSEGPMTTQTLLRLPAVIAMTGLRRSTIYKLMAEGRFPCSRKISSRLVAWSTADIVRWIDTREPSRSQFVASK